MNKLLYLKDAQIKDFIEKLYYAYRETFADPKKILNKLSTLWRNLNYFLKNWINIIFIQRFVKIFFY